MEDAAARVAEVDAYLAKVDTGPGQQLGNIWDSDAYGGYKTMEVPLYGAAFNYVSPEQFKAAVRSAAWEEPEHVRVFICDQADEVFAESSL
jgi:hypothetical protein